MLQSASPTAVRRAGRAEWRTTFCSSSTMVSTWMRLLTSRLTRRDQCTAPLWGWEGRRGRKGGEGGREEGEEGGRGRKGGGGGREEGEEGRRGRKGGGGGREEGEEGRQQDHDLTHPYLK